VYGGLAYRINQLPPLHHTPANQLKTLFKSQALHAEAISFRHPSTGTEMSFTVPLPGEFQKALEFLEPYTEGKSDS
jgi:23S rRNA-/tRNA-specific pseudouridylate synthase